MPHVVSQSLHKRSAIEHFVDMEVMEAIWVASEMRAGGAYAHSNLASDTMKRVEARRGGAKATDAPDAARGPIPLPSQDQVAQHDRVVMHLVMGRIHERDRPRACQGSQLAQQPGVAAHLLT